MKLIDIFEARYYGRHSPEDVRKRLIQIADDHNSLRFNVRVINAMQSPRGKDRVFARIQIVAAESEKVMRNEVDQFFKKHGIPYTEITEFEVRAPGRNDIRQMPSWKVTVLYDPGAQSQQQ